MDGQDNTDRSRGRPFKKGASGNPLGRPQGARNQTTLAVEALLDGEAEKITRKVIELALEGDPSAIRLCLERIFPARRERLVHFDLPPLDSVADAAGAIAAITAAVAGGEITSGDATELAKLVESFVRATQVHEFDRRLQALEHKVVVDIDELDRLTRELERRDQELAEAKPNAKEP
jgi:hypothetical protein